MSVFSLRLAPSNLLWPLPSVALKLAHHWQECSNVIALNALAQSGYTSFNESMAIPSEFLEVHHGVVSL